MQYIPYFIPLFFVLIVFVLSKAGWHNLVLNFAQKEEVDVKRLGIFSGKIGLVSYNNTIILSYNDQGIQLKSYFPFNLFHKKVFIPWKHIQLDDHPYFSKRWSKTIRLTKEELGWISISNKKFKEIEGYLVS